MNVTTQELKKIEENRLKFIRMLPTLKNHILDC
jgi:hypothetical protein